MRILIVDDEIQNRNALSELLRRNHHEVLAAVDGRQALELIYRSTSKTEICQTINWDIDLIFSDVRMPGLSGYEFMDALQKLYGNTHPPFVFMTAYGRLEDAISVMKKGAFHFLTKPLSKKTILSVLTEVEKFLKIKAKSVLKQVDLQDANLIYASKSFHEVVQLVERVANTLTPVLFIGESGTGKEVLAKWLHQKSARHNKPFVAFHPGSAPDSLIESELFGHEKGAYTGADISKIGLIRSAQGGTFFLDELSSMPLGVQAKLLRVLQNKEVLPLGSVIPSYCDVRFVSASPVSLESLVFEGKFREDLLYRLNVVVIEIPPLRSRPQDVDVLLDAFIKELSEKQKSYPLEVPQQTRQILSEYSWPGNVRELRNIVERALALADGKEFTVNLLPAHIAQASTRREISITVGSSIKFVEDKLIEETLKACAGDKEKAAHLLGIASRTLYRWEKHKETSKEKNQSEALKS